MLRTLTHEVSKYCARLRKHVLTVINLRAVLRIRIWIRSDPILFGWIQIRTIRTGSGSGSEATKNNIFVPVSFSVQIYEDLEPHVPACDVNFYFLKMFKFI
jgi:hypothetical protein